MTDREELRRLIDVIEKASGSGSVEQAVDDIKTFANTASFLSNKLEKRLKGGEVKTKPKSRRHFQRKGAACGVSRRIGLCRSEG